MAQPARILIAHKDPLARGYLRVLARRELRLKDCAEADSFEAMKAEFRDGAISLAIVDVDLPGMSGDVGLRYLAAHHPTIRIAVLFGSLGREALESLADSGIAALIPKQMGEKALADVLRGVLAGSSYVSFLAAADNEGAARETQLNFLDYELTGRQREVLRLLSLGHSNREIARMLGIAEGTVKVHVNAVFRILGVHNRVSAAGALRARFESKEEA